MTPPDGWPRNSEGCPSPLSKTANDSINLKLTIRVPTNARSFKYDFDFYTSEYLSFVCSAYNDQFVAILDTKAALDAKYGKNVAFDPKGNPINVNSAGFLDVCTPGSKTTPKPLTFPCKKGIGELSGTGFLDPFDKTAGAATSWLETLAPVVPGEIITVQFMVWNTGDHLYASTIVLDNWQWHLIPQGTPVTERPTD